MPTTLEVPPLMAVAPTVYVWPGVKPVTAHWAALAGRQSTVGQPLLRDVPEGMTKCEGGGSQQAEGAQMTPSFHTSDQSEMEGTRYLGTRSAQTCRSR